MSRRGNGGVPPAVADDDDDDDGEAAATPASRKSTSIALCHCDLLLEIMRSKGLCTASSSDLGRRCAIWRVNEKLTSTLSLGF